MSTVLRLANILSLYDDVYCFVNMAHWLNQILISMDMVDAEQLSTWSRTFLSSLYDCLVVKFYGKLPPFTTATEKRTGLMSNLNLTCWLHGSNLNLTQFYITYNFIKKYKKKGAISHIKTQKNHIKNTRETPTRQYINYTNHKNIKINTTWDKNSKKPNHTIHIRHRKISTKIISCIKNIIRKIRKLSTVIKTAISPTKYDNNNKKNEKIVTRKPTAISPTK
eukprot:530100_1